MEYERRERKVRASRHDWALLKKIARLRPQVNIPKLGLWHRKSDNFLWEGIVGQVCNRGGVHWYYRLEKKGELQKFFSSLSVKRLRAVYLASGSVTALRHYVGEQMEKYHVGRFREDNTLSVVANFRSFVWSDGRLGVRAQLDKLDATSQPIGTEVQTRERQARAYLMEKLMFFQRGKKHFAKRKPPSDYLINMGFARTLLAFDTRMKNVFREVFGLRVSDANYEPVEDWFLMEAYPRLVVAPSEFDRIIFQQADQILTLAASTP